MPGRFCRGRANRANAGGLTGILAWVRRHSVLLLAVCLSRDDIVGVAWEDALLAVRHSVRLESNEDSNGDGDGQNEEAHA